MLFENNLIFVFVRKNVKKNEYEENRYLSESNSMSYEIEFSEN